MKKYKRLIQFDKKCFKSILMIIIALVFVIGTINSVSYYSYAFDATDSAKMDSFIKDGRFTNGVSWPGNKKPILSTWNSYGCCAYCADYVKYCYGSNVLTSGKAFTNINEVRGGDVINVGPPNGGGHWFVVLKRNGNKLYVAEGNYSKKVRIGWNYTISGNTFSPDKRTFTKGYHFLDAVAPHEHNYNNTITVSKAPTFSSKGTWTFKCSCGASITKDIPALGDAKLKNGKYMIQSKADSNKYVSVPSDQIKQTGNVALYSKGKAEQIFHITKNSDDGSYIFSTKDDSLCIDVNGGKISGNVWLYSPNYTATQRWYISPTDDGYNRIVTKSTYFNMDLYNALTADGTNIGTHYDNGNKAQRYKFILVECDEHNWDEGKITKQATTTEEGEITYTCKDCHKTKIEKITKNHIHNFQIVSRIAPTCTEDGTTTIHCYECGTTITKKGDIELYSEWTTEKPKVSNGTTVQTKTQYSFSKREMDWKVVETGTIDYGSDWKGFDTGNSLYRQYNKTPVAAYENATTKVTVNTSHLGYIYWHWCSGNVYDKPYNRYVKSNRQNGYTTFHAYYSTEDIPFNAKANGYEKSKADICRDSYWWLQERIDVKRCSYTKYEKAQVGDFKTWSQWSDTPVKEDGNTKVKTRTLYRTRTFIAGKATGHKLVIDPKVPATETKTGLTEGSHCSVCNKVIKPQKVIPAKWKEISSEKIKNTELKKNVVVADKKKGGKYRITKVTKKGKKVTGGTVEYVAPYDKNCKLVSATGKVKLGGATFKVTSIRKDAFSGCTKLKKVVIGSYVKDIGANAFYGCKSLKSVTIKSSSIKKIGTNAFKGINSKAKIIVPKKKLSAYRKLIKKAKVPGTVKVITK